MRKGFFSGLTIGIFMTLTVLGTTTANAAQIRKEIYAVYNNIKLVINGKEITPRDGSGNVVEPFIYEGTTYLPVKAVANALGQPAEWDGATNTLYIGEKTISGTIGLDKIKDTYGGTLPTGKKITVRSEDIFTDNIIGAGYTRSSFQYVLGGKYSRLTGQLAVVDKTLDKDVKVTFRNVDTKEVIAEYTIKVNQKPVTVDINLVGVDKLEIYNGYSNYACLYNSELYPIAKK